MARAAIMFIFRTAMETHLRMWSTVGDWWLRFAAINSQCIRFQSYKIGTNSFLNIFEGTMCLSAKNHCGSATLLRTISIAAGSATNSTRISIDRCAHHPIVIPTPNSIPIRKSRMFGFVFSFFNKLVIVCWNCAWFEWLAPLEMCRLSICVRKSNSRHTWCIHTSSF